MMFACFCLFVITSYFYFWHKKVFFGSQFFTLEVQNFNFNNDFKPVSFNTGFQIFTQGQINFKSWIQILHPGAFDAPSRVLARIWDIIWRWEIWCLLSWWFLISGPVSDQSLADLTQKLPFLAGIDAHVLASHSGSNKPKPILKELWLNFD